MRIQRIVLYTLIILSGTTFADVYRHTDKTGNVQYSDTPHTADDAPISLPSLNEVPLSTTSDSIEFNTAQKPIVAYTITVDSPVDNAIFSHDSIAIPVQATISPSLQENHFLQYYQDGLTIGDPTKETTKTLENLSRGAHTIQISVIERMQNERGLTVEQTLSRSSVVTIYQQRQRKH